MKKTINAPHLIWLMGPKNMIKATHSEAKFPAPTSFLMNPDKPTSHHDQSILQPHASLAQQALDKARAAFPTPEPGWLSLDSWDLGEIDLAEATGV